MKKLALKCALVVGLGFQVLASYAAEMAVIVHPAAGVEALSADDITRIFLAKTKTYPNDTAVTPIARKEGSDIRNQFDEKVLGKNASQIKAYWSQMIFTGRATPPEEYATDDEVKKLVSSNPGMIGYISSSAVDSTVKVVFKAE